MGQVGQRDERERLLWVLGALVKARATTADTDGLVELLEYTGRKGDAAPVHIHPEQSESFYVLEGQVTIFLQERVIEAASGSFAFVSPGQRHTFRVESRQATFLQFMTSGGIFPFYKEVGEPAPSATLPPPSDEPWDIEALVNAMERHGMEVLGPPPGME